MFLIEKIEYFCCYLWVFPLSAYNIALYMLWLGQQPRRFYGHGTFIWPEQNVLWLEDCYITIAIISSFSCPCEFLWSFLFCLLASSHQNPAILFKQKLIPQVAPHMDCWSNESNACSDVTAGKIFKTQFAKFEWQYFQNWCPNQNKNNTIRFSGSFYIDLCNKIKINFPCQRHFKSFSQPITYIFLYVLCFFSMV